MLHKPEVDSTTLHESWTTAANSYNDVIGKTTLHGIARLVDMVHESHPFTSTSHLLDVGAGTGSLTTTVKRLSPETSVLATDIAEGMLAEIDRLAKPGVETKLADAHTLADLSDSNFSHTLSSFAIQFMPDPAAAARSMYRVTQPGGIVGMAIWGHRVGPKIIHLDACQNLDPDYVPALPAPKGAWYDETELLAGLKGAGLVAIGIETVNMPFEAGDLQGAVGYWFQSTNPVPKKMIRHWVECGGSREDLRCEYRKLTREMLERGESITCEAILGWGRKPEA